MKENLMLNWYKECVTFFNDLANQVTTCTITDTKLYVPVVTQDYAKLFEKLKSGFKRTINRNKYQSKE